MAPSHDFSSTLRKSGLKSTIPRTLVLEVLFRANTPLRIKDVCSRLSKKKSAIDLVTVYRTIEIFCLKGIVRRVDFGEDAAYYEYNDGKDNHHISCIICKRRSKIDGCFFPEVESRLKAKIPEFDSILRHSIEFFGMCKKCSKKSR